MMKPLKKTDFTKSAIIAVALYIAFQIFSDILAIKITSYFGIVATVATMLYPITFTLRDVIHKTIGKQGARIAIIASGVINVLMVLIFYIAIQLPVAGDWNLQKEFELIFGGVWRIVIASISAEIIGELIDTELYSFYVNKITKKFQWGRVIFSNSISSVVDSLIFVTIAFAGTMPAEVLISIIGGQILIKWIVSLVSAPMVYLTKDNENATI